MVPVSPQAPQRPDGPATPSTGRRTPGAVQATFAAALVDEWIRAGVTEAVVCPGSRSTPLAMAMAARSELTIHVRLDERGAGFYALGLGRATGRPAVVCVTSGTAAAELHAAVVEAHHGRVPLVVCTADRPPELHGVGAPQTIEQAGLYGGAVRWSAEPGVPVEEASGTWRSLGARAVAEASAGPLGPGPVHLNLAFREPLVGSAGPLPPGRPGGRPFHRVEATPAPARIGPGLTELLRGRGVVVAGAGSGPPASVLALAEHLGWPVLADPRSGCRVDHPLVVAAADAIARSGRKDLRPDVVLRLGSAWASKALPAFTTGAAVVAVDPWWRWEDPERSADIVVRSEPGAFADALRAGEAAPVAEGWVAAWQTAERLAQAAIDEALAAAGLCEPLVARSAGRLLPGGTTVVVSSSMPVRDLEWFAPAVPSPPRVLANRGANGIDGVCSTALGVAAACGGPVVGVLGDLAFFHDLSSLVGAGGPGAVGGGPRGVPGATGNGPTGVPGPTGNGPTGVPGPTGAPSISCTLLVVDNGGGGIFEFLPQAGALDRSVFDRLFGTPQAADVIAAAAGLGVETVDVGTPAELDAVLRAAPTQKGCRVARVRVPARPGNVAVHERIHDAVGAALARRD